MCATPTAQHTVGASTGSEWHLCCFPSTHTQLLPMPGRCLAGRLHLGAPTTTHPISFRDTHSHPKQWWLGGSILNRFQVLCL